MARKMVTIEIQVQADGSLDPDDGNVGLQECINYLLENLSDINENYIASDVTILSERELEVEDGS